METLRHHIDISSSTILSDIALKIRKPLDEIKRIQEMKQVNNSIELNNLNEVVLQNSETIELLIAEMLKIEKEKKIEIKINDSLQFPELINKYRDKSIVLFKEDIEWLIRLEALILSNCDCIKFNLQIYLPEFLISERTFFRKIRQLTGLTPVKYFSKIKLFKARKLLIDNDSRNIYSIALRVGMPDQSYFTSKFKSEFGATPNSLITNY